MYNIAYHFRSQARHPVYICAGTDYNVRNWVTKLLYLLAIFNLHYLYILKIWLAGPSHSNTWLFVWRTRCSWVRKQRTAYLLHSSNSLISRIYMIQY